MTTLPTELLELLALHPPGHVILDAEARVLAYSNENSRFIDASPEPGMTRVTRSITFYGPDTETNMRSALSACEALIEAGFNVEVRADKIVNHGGLLLITEWGGTWVNVYAGRKVVTPIDGLCHDRGLRNEIEALVKPWGGDVDDNFGLTEGPPVHRRSIRS
jgi:hypothetical protein